MGLVVYRYRTKVIVGPWRFTREAAATDAVKARQARYHDGSLDWKVPGEIEVQRQAAAQHERPTSKRGSRIFPKRLVLTR